MKTKTLAIAQEAVEHIKDCMEMHPESEVAYIVKSVTAHAAFVDLANAVLGESKYSELERLAKIALKTSMGAR